MCLAVPVAALLLIVFAGLTVLRLSGPVSPNAIQLAELLNGGATPSPAADDRPAAPKAGAEATARPA